MKSIIKNGEIKMKIVNLIKILGFVAIFTLGACNTENLQDTNLQNESMNFNYSQNNDFTQQMDCLDSIPMGELNEKEIEGLLFMREEEKLAHDVYRVFYEKYNRGIFKNIARSEQKHTNAVLRLINRYELTDPVSTNDIGVFINQDLQNLYDALVTKGNNSLIDALAVGAEIEEVDILDLENYIKDIEENDDLLHVYNNLLRGSRNHLRAYTKNLEKLDIVYEPQHMDQSTYEAIINDPHEKGNHNKDGKGDRGNRGHRGNRGGK